MDLKAMLEMAEQMKAKLGASDQEAAAARITGEAGGGMVRVVLNGRYEAIAVNIDPKALAAGDRQFLEDLLRAAFNQASSRVLAEMQRKVSSFAESMGVDMAALGALLPKA